MPGRVNTAAILALSGGAVLAYSGLKGKSVSSTVRSFLKGNNPAANPTATGIGIAMPSNASSALASADAATPGMLARASGSRATIVTAAQSQLGKPYRWATPLSANDPDPSSFDCSGLTMWCYNKIGAHLAHYTGSQYTQLQHYAFSEAQPGDLVFYSDGITIYHVGVYIGGNQLIEAPDYGIPVRIRAVHSGDTDLMPTVGVVPNG